MMYCASGGDDANAVTIHGVSNEQHATVNLTNDVEAILGKA